MDELGHLYQKNLCFLNMEDLLIIEDFLGKPLIVCPYQFKKCEHQFSIGDDALLSCECEECYETKKCIKH